MKQARSIRVLLFTFLVFAFLLQGQFVSLTQAKDSRPSAKNGAPEKIANSVTIYRDKWGVPHVYGPTDYSVMFGFMYAQAEDNFWQIEDSYIQSIGRAAEVYGEVGAVRALESDIINRQLEINRLAQQDYANASKVTKDICDATADGLNYFLEKNPQVKPRLITKFEPWHLLAFNRFAQYQLFILKRLGLRADELRASVQEAGKKTAGLGDWATGRLGEELASVQPEANDTEDIWSAGVIGSNTWAITPKKSASGHAMLLVNPHQPFFGPGQWIEGHIHSDSGWNLSGASFPGSPFPSLGHNDNLGWSHTVNAPDVIDAWEEKF
ncbi:MAG: penicillin acylase family protein, partial [Acidobacteriota bacterium]